MSVWSEFQPLTSVILGKLFETENLLSFLKLPLKWKQHFQIINEQGINELEAIASSLSSLGLTVYRTNTYDIQTANGPAGPPLSPRDWFLTYGDTTIVGNDAFANHHIRTSSTDHLLGHTYQVPHKDLWANTAYNELDVATLPRPYMHTANVLRCGMDVFMTSNLGRTGNEEGRACVVQALKQVNPQVRIHYVDCEEHLDGYIFFVRPGLLLSRIAKDRLPLFFKNWTIIAVDETAEVYNKVMQYKWKKLNPIVAQEYAWFLQSNPKETLFSLNGLSINETTVMLPGISKSVFTQLEKLGINCVSVDMRALTYWDSGLHCCTSELERIENLEDYS